MSRRQLAGSAIFAADGTATVRAGNVPVGEVWRMSSVSVRTTSALRTSCTIYRASATPANRIDVTENSGNGDTTDTPFELAAGEQLVCVWTGGTPGARADVTANGEG